MPVAVTISKEVYDKLKADEDRINWLEEEMEMNGVVDIERRKSKVHLFSISSQHVGHSSTVREVIDRASPHLRAQAIDRANGR